jgi:hypothetical protein
LSALNSTKGKDKLYFFSYFDPSKPYQEAIRKYAPIEIRSTELPPGTLSTYIYLISGFYFIKMT